MKLKKVACTLLILIGLGFAMESQNISPNKTVAYKEIEGDSLCLHIFEPAYINKPAAVIVFFFGGGWTVGDPKQFYQQSAYFASRGIVAISAEYRIKNIHGTTPFDCVEDGKSAIRWVREHAKELNIDPDKIVAAGGSAGGHIALCTALIEGLDNPNENASISSVPNAVLAYNPVLDTTNKGYGAKKVENRETEISPCHHVKKGLPPMLFFHGKEDTTVPFENAERFNSLMNAAGNDCNLVAVKGVGHGFFNGSFFRKGSDDKYFNLTMYDSDVFLEKLGYIAGRPTIVKLVN